MLTLNPSTSVRDAYSVNWNYQQNHVLEGLKGLLGQDDLLLTDVTLACDGEFIQAHKLVMSLCSSFFRDLFMRNKTDKSSMIIVLGHVSGQNLRHLLNFMYQGKVEVPIKDMESFLEAGKMLKVEGLVGTTPESTNEPVQVEPAVPSEPPTAGFPIIASTSGACDEIPHKKSRISDLVTLNEGIPTISKPTDTGQDSEPHLNPEDVLGYSEDDEFDQVDDDEDAEEGIDFNLVKTEPIQVYSGFTTSNHSEPILADNVEEAFSDTLSSFVTETQTDDASTLPGTSSRTYQRPDQRGSKTAKRKRSTGAGRPFDAEHVGGSKFKKRSLIWRYFETLEDSNMKCKLCNRLIKFSRTHNLRNHMQASHTQEFDQMKSEEELVRTESFAIKD